MQRPAAVDHGGAEVTEYAVRISDGGPLPVQAEERVLHQVLGRGPLTGEQQREPHQAQGVFSIQLVDPRLGDSPHAP